MRRILSFGLLSACLMALVACVAEGDAGPAAALDGIENAAASQDVQPASATYRCGEDGVLLVQNQKSSVVVTDPLGETVTLPASPATQQARYGQGGYALVLEGREALYMKGGKEPLTCQR